MRNLFLLFLVLATSLLSAQNKQMSLEDAILGRYSYLRPESMNGLSWKTDDVFSFIDNDTLWAETAKNGKRSAVISLGELNAEMKQKNSSGFSRFPGYSWIGGNMLLARHSNKFIVFNTETKKIALQIELPEKAENAEFCLEGKFVAFTVDDDLFVTFEDGKTLQITEDGGNGIVNGKTVHRNEFGISKGIFISPKGNYVAFYRKDETMVSDYPVVDFMGVWQNTLPLNTQWPV